MAIDPMLYEKISGRSGDPHKRLGETLAGAERHKSRISADKAQQQMFRGGYVRWGMWSFWAEVFRRLTRRSDS